MPSNHSVVELIAVHIFIVRLLRKGTCVVLPIAVAYMLYKWALAYYRMKEVEAKHFLFRQQLAVQQYYTRTSVNGDKRMKCTAIVLPTVQGLFFKNDTWYPREEVGGEFEVVKW